MGAFARLPNDFDSSRDAKSRREVAMLHAGRVRSTRSLPFRKANRTVTLYEMQRLLDTFEFRVPGRAAGGCFNSTRT